MIAIRQSEFYDHKIVEFSVHLAVSLHQSCVVAINLHLGGFGPQSDHGNSCILVRLKLNRSTSSSETLRELGNDAGRQTQADFNLYV